jgi:nitrogen-specific signal transduction histidine kinase
LENINALIDLNIEIIQQQIKNNLKIEKHYGQLPQIICISGHINQVILNIFSNAMQSIEGKGSIFSIFLPIKQIEFA